MNPLARVLLAAMQFLGIFGMHSTCLYIRALQYTTYGEQVMSRKPEILSCCMQWCSCNPAIQIPRRATAVGVGGIQHRCIAVELRPGCWGWKM